MKHLLLLLVLAVNTPVHGIIINDVVLDIQIEKNHIQVGDSFIVTVSFKNFSMKDYYIAEISNYGNRVLQFNNSSNIALAKYRTAVPSLNIPINENMFAHLPARSTLEYRYTYFLEMKDESPNLKTPPGLYITNLISGETFFLGNERAVVVTVDYVLDLVEVCHLKSFIEEKNIYFGSLLSLNEPFFTVIE